MFSFHSILVPRGLLLAALLVCAASPAAGAEADATTEGADATTGEKKPDRFGIVPVGAVLYSPETSVVFAAAALAHFRFGDVYRSKDSTALLAAAYTLEHQVLVNLGGDLYLSHNDLLVEYELEFSHFPSRFFGIGNDTSQDDEERYIRRSYVAGLSPRQRIWRSLYVGPAVRFKHYDMLEVEEGGQLDTQPIEGRAGGRDLGAGVSVVWDSRDGSLNPRHGVYAELDVVRSAAYTGSEFEFTTYTLDARWYVPTIARQVLALQGFVELHDGEPPFFLLARFGGNALMRGHYQGRYRDRQVAVAQAEYRVPIWWRFGVVAFGGAGQVARDVGDFSPRELHYAAGGGLRFMLSRDSRINVRADAAWGEDDVGFYVAIGEAF